jgi:hypothetical protein
MAPGAIVGVPPAGQASAVAALVRGTLAPQVLAAESALTTADRHMALRQAGREDDGALARTLTQQEVLLTAASAGLSSLGLPRLAEQSMLELKSAVEDLALFSDQLADLFHEASVDLQTFASREAAGEVVSADVMQSVAYQRRVHSLLKILRRAEMWLKTLDQETGAQVTLPGFECDGWPLLAAVTLPR